MGLRFAFVRMEIEPNDVHSISFEYWANRYTTLKVNPRKNKRTIASSKDLETVRKATSKIGTRTPIVSFHRTKNRLNLSVHLF